MRKSWLVAIVLVFALSGCYDDSGSYATLNDARDGAVFDRGVLPDILPPSANDIRVTSDGDRSEGEFWFDPADFSRFATQFESFYQPFEYSAGGRTWAFFCDSASGHCFYSTR